MHSEGLEVWVHYRKAILEQVSNMTLVEHIVGLLHYG